jgi:hypothetical protein
MYLGSPIHKSMTLNPELTKTMSMQVKLEGLEEYKELDE